MISFEDISVMAEWFVLCSQVGFRLRHQNLFQRSYPDKCLCGNQVKLFPQCFSSDKRADAEVKF